MRKGAGYAARYFDNDEKTVKPVSVSAERREFRRLTLPIPVRFRLRDSPVVRHGTMVNISRVGGALLTPVPLPVDSVVDPMRFSLPSVGSRGGVKISVTAGVVATELQLFADSSERYRSGLVFLNLTGKSFESVCRVISHELDQSNRQLSQGFARH